MNTSRNTPAHVSEELDRLGVSDEGIEMSKPQVAEPQVSLLPAEVDAIRAFDRSITRHGSFISVSEDTFDRLAETCAELARQLEQVEAERDRYKRTAELLQRDLIEAEGALHPKERDNG